MRTYDRNATKAFFDETYSKADEDIVAQNPEAALHHRDRILLEKLLPGIGNGLHVLDFGCGQGRLVVELLRRGHIATGVEKHEGMHRVAQRNLAEAKASPGQITLGGVESLAQFPAGSIDAFLAMGVFQYVEDTELAAIMKAAHRLLRPGGHLFCTFQNAFFDLFTFNKYTVDFIANELLGSLVTETEKQKLTAGVETLLTRSDAPPYSPTRARDNVFVRLTNPLTVASEMDAHGFRLSRLCFYDFFGTPPLLSGALPDLSARIASQFEVKNSERWEGHFMANAFLVASERK